MDKEKIRERLVELILSVPPFAIIPTRACGKATTQNSVVWVNHLAKHLIAHGVTLQQWIPDAEQTPEVNPETGYRDVAVLTESRKLQIATWDGSNYYIEISKAEDLDDTITHWAYLPPFREPTKEVEQ